MALVEEMEPEIEDLLLRIAPSLPNDWQGASSEEIDKIETIAGRPLPKFYLWFLSRMGRSMGPLTYPTLDFTAPRVLSCYADELFPPHPRFLMIGHESDEVMPAHLLYDFDHPARDDARIVSMEHIDGVVRNQFETFREMIGWGKFLSYRVNRFPHRCTGAFVDDEGDVLSRLDPLMESLGFTAPIPTGACCALYDSTQTGMVSSCAPGDEPCLHFFVLGGHDVGSLRRTLGAIRNETGLGVEIRSWDPPSSG